MGGLPAVLRNFHPRELWVGNNPPITAYRALLSEAAPPHVRGRSLRPGGRLAMVANRPLPYERLCKGMLTTCDIAEQSGGFKILEGVR